MLLPKRPLVEAVNRPIQQDEVDQVQGQGWAKGVKQETGKAHPGHPHQVLCPIVEQLQQGDLNKEN